MAHKSEYFEVLEFLPYGDKNSILSYIFEICDIDYPWSQVQLSISISVWKLLDLFCLSDVELDIDIDIDIGCGPWGYFCGMWIHPHNLLKAIVIDNIVK